MYLILILILLLIAFILIFSNTSIFYNESNDYLSLSESSILEGGEEYRSQKSRDKAVLFVHGFPGSPKMFYLIRELAEEDGYDVYNPRLPGFATENRKDLINTNFSMWYNYIRDYYLELKKEYKNIYIVGTSMGGALTLKLSQEFSSESDKSPVAIAITAAPVFLNYLFKGVIRTPFLYLSRVIALFVKYIPPARPRKGPEDDQDGDTQWVGHRGLFPKQIYSLMMGLRDIRKNLYRVDQPCYLCQARKDRTVPFNNLYYIQSKVSSDTILTRTIDLSSWRHTNHSLFIYKSVGPKLWREISLFFNTL